MLKNIIVVSKNSDKELKNNLREYGDVFELSQNPNISEFEACHPDMQICKTSESYCVLSPDIDKKLLNFLSENKIEFEYGKTILSKEYPYNIAYNVLIGDKIFVHNIKYTDKILFEKLISIGKRPISVKQGYSGCSSIFIKNTLITSDYGIYKKLKQENIKVILFREPEKIILEGFNNGFIGGCCGYSKETGLLINCEYQFLPKYFVDELKSSDIDFTCVGSGQLTDIGGIVIFTCGN